MLSARHDAYRPDLRHRLYDEDARHDRIIGEVPLEERLVLGHVLYPDGPDPRLELDDSVNQQERVAVRDELPYLRRPQRHLHASTSLAVRPSMSLRLKSRNIRVSVPSSPASKISPTPRLANLSITATQRTGESIWLLSASRTSPAVASTPPSDASTIGISGSRSATSASIAFIAIEASSMSGEWKAPATSSSTLRPRTFSATPSSAPFSPEMTVCRGVLKLAATTTPSASLAARTTSMGSAPIRATIPPGFSTAASFISRSLSATSRTASSSPRLPAACAAAYSPRECPATTSASIPASRSL